METRTQQPVLPHKILRWILFGPFILLWKMVTWICNAIGIILSLVLGTALVGAGYLLTATIIGAIIGIPMMLVGVFLLARALY